jgi:CBS domain-containing protein
MVQTQFASCSRSGEAASVQRINMATLKDILAGKDSKVISVDPRATVMEAAVLMNQYRVGFLVVIDGERPVGVFSERDILRRVVVARLDPGKTLVNEVMTIEMLVCNPRTSVDEARSVMKNRRIRHLPVVDEQERLVGLVSIGDLNAFNANAQEQTLHVLEEYIYGRT